MARPFKKYNVAKVREVIQNDNTTKKFWDRVGKLVIFKNDDGSESGMLELVSFDKSISLSVFLDVPKEANTQQAPRQNQQQEKTVNDFDIPEDEEIKIENIPF